MTNIQPSHEEDEINDILAALKKADRIFSVNKTPVAITNCEKNKSIKVMYLSQALKSASCRILEIIRSPR